MGKFIGNSIPPYDIKTKILEKNTRRGQQYLTDPTSSTLKTTTTRAATTTMKTLFPALFQKETKHPRLTITQLCVLAPFLTLCRQPIHTVFKL